MKKFCLVAILLLLCPVQAKADVTIGLIAPITGQYAVFGEQLRRGAEQAVADINAAGGIAGEKIILKQADDACDPKLAVSAASQMVSTGVKFVVGHYCSGSAIPASKVFMEEGLLMVSPAATNPRLTDEAKELIFRVTNRDDQEGGVMGNYVVKHFPDKKIALAHDNSTYGKGFADEVKKALNANGVNEVLFETYTPAQRDYSSLVTKLKQANIQVLVVGGYHTETGLITRQLKEQGVDIQVIGGNALYTNEFWSITGTSGEGVLMSFAHDPRKLPEAQKALATLRQSGYEPEGYTLNSYAAVQTIAEGMKRTGTTNPSKVAAALREKPIATVLGEIAFDAKGDIKNPKIVMYRWHDGKYAEVAE